MKKKIRTMTEVILRLDNKDRQRLLKKLHNGMGIGEEIKLTVTDYRNRFDLGEFVAVIKEWRPYEPIRD